MEAVFQLRNNSVGFIVYCSKIMTKRELSNILNEKIYKSCTRFACQQKFSYLNLINIPSQKNVIIAEYQKNDSSNNLNVSKIVFTESMNTKIHIFNI